MILAILSCALLVMKFPSGENHLTGGSGLELEASQLSSSVSPSFTVVSPLITGGLKPLQTVYTNVIHPILVVLRLTSMFYECLMAGAATHTSYNSILFTEGSLRVKHY